MRSGVDKDSHVKSSPSPTAWSKMLHYITGSAESSTGNFDSSASTATLRLPTDARVYTFCFTSTVCPMVSNRLRVIVDLVHQGRVRPPHLAVHPDRIFGYGIRKSAPRKDRASASKCLIGNTYENSRCDSFSCAGTLAGKGENPIRCAFGSGSFNQWREVLAPRALGGARDY